MASRLSRPLNYARSLLTQASKPCLSKSHDVKCPVEITLSRRRPLIFQPMRNFGQPVAITHPHLLDNGQLTPGITAAEYGDRRERLVGRIIDTQFFKSDNDHVIIVPGANQKYMTKNIPYKFKQNTDLHYFTGFLEPDSCLVLLKRRGSHEFETVMFVPETDETNLVWHGPGSGPTAAVDVFRADRAFKSSDLKRFLDDFKSKSTKFSIWYDFSRPTHPEIHQVMSDLILESAHDSIHSHRPIIDDMKLKKSPAELKLVRETCNVAALSLKDVIQFAKPGMSESLMEAKMSFSCQLRGADRLSFPPVVASGANANVIHYIRNDNVLKHGDLVLMDTGCEYHGYSSDLTRTWPVSGSYSPAQRILYEIVLETQRLCMERFVPGEKLDHIHRFMLKTLARKLRDAGVFLPHVHCHLEDSLAPLGQLCCPHHVSHYLGMDVHDSSTMSRVRPLEPNMVVTNEPGLYFPSYLKIAQMVHSDFVGLGMRIEDDVLITSSDPDILTSACPVDIEAMERLAAS